MPPLIEIRPGRAINIEHYPNSTADTTVFLIHGLGGRSSQWQQQIDFLKDKYTIVAPDLLGHGNSSKPKLGNPNPYSFNELNADLNTMFERYASNQNIIIGHSYGGAFAATLTKKHQTRIKQLILLAPTPCQVGIPIPFLFRLPASLMEFLRPVLEFQFQHAAFLPSDDPALVKSEILAGRNNPMYVIQGMIIGMNKIPTLDVTDLPTKTLILLGKQDRLIPPIVSTNFYQTLPHHQFVMLDNAAHLIMMEKPKETNQLIGVFLDGSNCHPGTA